LEEYKDRWFTYHVPILNQRFHRLTQNGPIKYTDAGAIYILNALTTLAHLEFKCRSSNMRQDRIDQQLWEFYKIYLLYSDNTLSKMQLGKYGQTRKHLLGTRVHFSGRGVIIPITECHYGDELHIPWILAVQCLQLEILNFLQERYRLTLNEAQERLTRAQVHYDEIIDQIFKDLIKECPYKGLPIIFWRNPSIQVGALQLLFVTKVKIDVDDTTIGFSPYIVTLPNADLIISVGILLCY
jgi:hypothetical protein